MRTSFRALLCTLILCFAAQGAKADGWPANFEGVLLQGFYWDSYNETRWVNMKSNVDELSKYFKLIWIPNVSKSASGGMGYDPVYWFTNHNSRFGTENQLREMIAAFKEKGTGIIEDVIINHRSGATNWYNFPDEQWNGTTWHIGLEGICSNDEMAYTSGQPKPTGAPDTGENFDGSRDLDHTNANVQNNCKNFCKYLLQDLGFVGFRLDMVKGYSAQYTKMYNQYANPTYCVGEYWDGSYDALAAWIEGTGKTSAAFDFAFKYALNNAFGSNNMSQLTWMAGDKPQPAGLIHNYYQQYAVTFIDNHDTYRDHNKFGGSVLAANAFMLCSPGTPCVFLRHWLDHKAAIKKMIEARNNVGVTNTSSVNVLKSERNCYMAEVTGKRGKLVVRIGSSGDKPSGYSDSQIYCKGSDYCIWTTVGTPGPDDPDDPGDLPSKLYLQGHVNGYEWATNQGVAATNNNGKYTFSNVTINKASDSSNGFFSFCTSLGSSWDDVNGSDRYGSSSKDELISMGSSSSIVKYPGGAGADGCQSWAIAPRNYTIEADLKNMRITIKDPAGIEAVEESKGGPVEYYNLQGIRVSNPCPGQIYIVRSEGKAERVLYR